MTPHSPTPIMIMVSLAMSALFVSWRVAARWVARRKATTALAGERRTTVAARVLFNAALIVAGQWAVIAHHPGRWLLLGVLGAPALIVSYVLTRALTVSMRDRPRRRDGGWP